MLQRLECSERHAIDILFFTERKLFRPFDVIGDRLRVDPNWRHIAQFDRHPTCTKNRASGQQPGPLCYSKMNRFTLWTDLLAVNRQPTSGSAFVWRWN